MKKLFSRLGRFWEVVLEWIRDGIARAIIWARVPPNALTLSGPLVMALVFWPLLEGDQWTAGWVVLLAITFDCLDGAGARASREVTQFGAYLDSVMDRYSDMLLLFGRLFYFLASTETPERNVWLAVWCLATAGTVATSYARSRAEKLIPACEVGFLERPERSVALVVGLVSGNIHAALIVVATFGNLIAAQRICYTRAVLEGRTPAAGFRFWTYRRASAEYAMLSTVCFFFIVLGHLIIPPPA